MANDAHRSNEHADGKTTISDQLRHSSGSYELVLSAVILGLGGLLLDRWLGTLPIFTVVLTVLGFVGAGLSIYYRYRHQITVLQQETAALRAAASGRGSS